MIKQLQEIAVDIRGTADWLRPLGDLVKDIKGIDALHEQDRNLLRRAEEVDHLYFRLEALTIGDLVRVAWACQKLDAIVKKLEGA